MLATPSTSHVNYDHIYEPSEDSYLLLDTLSSPNESAFLKPRFPSTESSPFVLEVGPGSGVVTAFVTAHAKHVFGRSDVATFGLDANDLACAATRKTANCAIEDAKVSNSQPGIFLDAICGDLTASIRPQSVDVLVFNPPYVPTEALPSLTDGPGDNDFERDMRLSSLSTDGGIDGMETTNRLLQQLPDVLSTRGVAYILLCAQNKPDRVVASIRGWPPLEDYEWQVERISSSGKQAGWEKLCILRIWRRRPDS